METFQLSPLAERDLSELYAYVADASGSERARSLELEVVAALGRLVRMPGMGHRRDDLADARLRVWRVHRWLIVYRPETSPLEVVRVLGGWQDLAGPMRERRDE